MEGKQAIENSTHNIHGMGGGSPIGVVKKFFKELYQKKKKQNKATSLLFKSKQHGNNNMAFKLHSLCWGRCKEKKCILWLVIFNWSQ